MTETKYTADATRPEERHFCTVLNAGDYPEMYDEKVRKILENIGGDDISLKHRVRQTLGSFESSSDGKLAQSSPYRLVVLQNILPEGEVLVARPRLQTAKEINPDNKRGFYVDCGLNLVTMDGKYEVNPILAKTLADDLKNVGIKLKYPKLIPFRILIPQIDEKSPSGLVFRLSEKGKDTAKNSVLNTSDFQWYLTFFNNGLFRTYLDWFGRWEARYKHLADSNDNGRVVVETTDEDDAREEAKKSQKKL